MTKSEYNVNAAVEGAASSSDLNVRSAITMSAKEMKALRPRMSKESQRGRPKDLHI